MCDWHYKYSVTCLIRHTKEIREMCRIEQDVRILRFYFNLQKYFGTINFRRMSQDVGKLRGRIAQVPLYRSWQEIFNTTIVCLYLFWPLDIYFFKEGVGISFFFKEGVGISFFFKEGVGISLFSRRGLGYH